MNKNAALIDISQALDDLLDSIITNLEEEGCDEETVTDVINIFEDAKFAIDNMVE